MNNLFRLVIGVALLQLPRVAVGDDEVVTVKLAGGAQVTARLLQRNDDRVVLDLGHEVVTVDAKQVLSIGGPEHQPEGQTREQEYYTLGRLDEAPVPELVKRHGDAVVTVTTPVGLGSGFIISSEGHLITNYHVVEESLKVKVTVFQRKKQGYEKRQLNRVKILAINPLRDLALLQLDNEEMGRFGHQACRDCRETERSRRESDLRDRKSARTGTLGHPGDRQFDHPHHGPLAIHSDRRFDQPRQ